MQAKSPGYGPSLITHAPDQAGRHGRRDSRGGGAGRGQRAGRVVALAVVASLTGCASPKWLENRAACAIGADRAYVISMWGPLGIASPLQPATICK